MQACITTGKIPLLQLLQPQLVNRSETASLTCELKSDVGKEDTVLSNMPFI